MNNHYEIYNNQQYREALEYILDGTEFDIMIDKEYPCYFIDRYVNVIKEDLENDPDDIESKNILIFLEKSKFIIESEYSFIFDYYSEYYKKHFYVSWDSEGTATVLNGNIVSIFDNHLFEYILKPIRLNYIRKCKGLGLKYEREDFKLENENKYEKKNLIDDPYLYAIIFDNDILLNED